MGPDSYWIFLNDKDPLPRGFCPDTLRASYYNDTPAPYELDGPITGNTFTTFVLARPESCIAFKTDTYPPAPGVNGTFWSARWIGLLLVPDHGDYVAFRDLPPLPPTRPSQGGRHPARLGRKGRVRRLLPRWERSIRSRKRRPLPLHAAVSFPAAAPPQADGCSSQ